MLLSMCVCRMALLRAASYGKTFDIDIDAAPFVSACKTLRVLNSLRGECVADRSQVEVLVLLQNFNLRRVPYLSVSRD